MAFASLPPGLEDRLWLNIPVIRLAAPCTKVAISLPELIRQTNAFSVKRRAGCVPTLKSSRPKELYLEYNVVCHESYSDPAGHDVQVQFDLEDVEKTQDARRLDVRVSCSCPAFLYWGAQWNLHQRDGLRGEPRPLLKAPTERLDLRANFVICKHVKAVLERVLPAVQHNIQNIVREKAKRVRKEVEKAPPTPKEKRLRERQEEMRHRQLIERILEEPDEEKQKRMLDRLIHQESERLEELKEKEREPAPAPAPAPAPEPEEEAPAPPPPAPEPEKKVVTRDEPAVEAAAPPPAPAAPPAQPSLADLVKEEARKLQRRKPPAKGKEGSLDEGRLLRRLEASLLAAAAPPVAQTPAFKAWFDGSKVTDAQGNPQVMYHATQAGIDVFRPFTHFGTQGAALARDKALSDFYLGELKRPDRYMGANIMPVYLKVVNPLRMPDLASIDINTGEPLEETEEEQYSRGWEGEEAVATTLLEMGVIDIDEFEAARGNEAAFRLLEEKGYDGIVYRNAVEDPGSDSWIVFSPSQVKSAIGNVAFDPGKPSITAAGPKRWTPQEMQDEARFWEETRGAAKHLDWRQDDAFPVALIEPGMTLADWRKFWAQEVRDEGDFDRKGYYGAMEKWWSEHPEEHLIIAEHEDGKFHIWDGWHRAAVSKLKGMKTVPAFVGTRKRG